MGLFMVIISPDSLRLTAIYGFASGSAVLLLGAVVGDWIDRTPRLSAARTTLVIQNMSVLVCAVCIFFVITYKSEIVVYWPDEGLLILCYAGIIMIAVVSTLASMGTKIAVQKDWIVEICGRDKDALASMSSTMRAIDLVTLTVAPILTGQIMTYASTSIGALFIGGWNLVSVFVEYYLLWKVYDIVPALREKKFKRRMDKEPNNAENEETPIKEKVVETDELEIEVRGEEVIDLTRHSITENNEEDISSPVDKEIRKRSPGAENGESAGCARCLRKTFSGVVVLIRGWKTYMQYNVAFAGLGLAMLYMTVLGFDNITVGFSYSQGINESIMGILMAGGGLVGVCGALLYPIVRRKVGLERTGLFGFFLEIVFLSLCVASVWAPGSPFDLLYAQKSQNSAPVSNETLNLTSTMPTMPVAVLLNSSESAGYSTVLSNNVTSVPEYNVTVSNVTSSIRDTTPPEGPESVISIWLLLAGIIGARCGLWMADLTITQLFLENVEENQRGIVNGVQTSLNQLMDMLKFVMVIIAPQPEVFGLLVLISFGFILLGWLFYAKYSHKARGHLFHFDKMRKCECVDATNNNVVSNDAEV